MNIPDRNGRTSLMLAAQKNHRLCVPELIKAGADVNFQNKDGETALHCVSRCGHVECMPLLLKAGADVNAQNKDGETALHCVSRRRHVECMTLLLKAGADVNVADCYGTTPLMNASRDGHLECVRKLQKAGAKVNATNYYGATALRIAAGNDRHRCLDLLLKARADVNRIDNDDRNALLELEMHSPNYVACMKKLLRAGIHINKHDKLSNRNVLERILFRDEPSKYENAITLLSVAGEILEATDVGKIPEKLKLQNENFELRNICRGAIRKHLLKLDLHQNLFSRIPLLGLPPMLTQLMCH